jgi:hypothetical protein
MKFIAMIRSVFALLFAGEDPESAARMHELTNQHTNL